MKPSFEKISRKIIVPLCVFLLAFAAFARCNDYISKIWKTHNNILNIILPLILDFSLALLVLKVIYHREAFRITDNQAHMLHAMHGLFYFTFSLTYSILFLRVTKLSGAAFFRPFYRMLHYNFLPAAAVIFIFITAVSAPWFKKRSIFFFQLFTLLSSIMYATRSRDFWVCLLFIMLVAASGTSAKILLRIVAITNLSLTLLMYHLSVNGYIEYVVAGTGSSVKRGFGFNQGNAVSMEIFFLIAYFLFLQGKEVRDTGLIDLSIAGFAFFFTRRYAGGRTSMVALLMLLIVLVLNLAGSLPFLQSGKGLHTIVYGFHRYFVTWIYLFMTLFSMLTAYFYNPDHPYRWMSAVGAFFDLSTLRSRLECGHKAFQLYTPKIFGQYLAEGNTKDGYMWLDNFYIRLFFRYGIALFIIFLAVMTLIMIRLLKSRQYLQMDILAIVALVGFLEAVPGDVMYNVFPLILFQKYWWEPQGTITIFTD